MEWGRSELVAHSSKRKWTPVTHADVKAILTITTVWNSEYLCAFFLVFPS